MGFGQYILEMEVLVTEALCNTVDCRCSNETLEPSPCTSGQTTIEILQLKLYYSDKTNNMEPYGMAKKQLKFNLKIMN